MYLFHEGLLCDLHYKINLLIHKCTSHAAIFENKVCCVCALLTSDSSKYFTIQSQQSSVIEVKRKAAHNRKSQLRRETHTNPNRLKEAGKDQRKNKRATNND